MRPILPVLALGLFTAGAALAADVPPKPATSTVPGRCEWSWKTGGGLGAWTERCDLDTGIWEVGYDGKAGAFVLTVDGGDPVVVLQAFDKAKDAGVGTILPELRTRGYIPDDDECVFEPAAIRPAPRTLAFFEIRPTGARLKAFEATPTDEVPEDPCPEYGAGPEGLRYFMTDIRFPDRVVYFNEGQDGTMFDPRTVTLE